MSRSSAIALNVAGLYAIAGVLLVAFAMQVMRGELPCPLCLLQRAFFVAMAVGPILNLRHGPRPGHYALSMLAALAGAAVSARQILLHILPGDPGYGSAVFGYHYYTWAFLLFIAALVLIALMLVGDRQFDDGSPPCPVAAGTVAVWLVVGLTVANVFSTFAICGMNVCPDNPIRYDLFQRG
jgi:disulfide bond formation protein DsbB